MYKKNAVLLIAFLLVLNMVACSKTVEEEKSAQETTTVETTEEETQPGIIKVESERPVRETEIQEVEADNDENITESLDKKDDAGSIPDDLEEEKSTTPTKATTPSETTKPTVPSKETTPVETTKPTAPSKETTPAETTKPTTPSKETTPAETTKPTTPVETPDPVAELTEYERYMAMTGDEQMEFVESFGSIEAFFEWLNSAKAEHEALKPDIPIEDGKIDLSGVVGNGN